MSAIRALNMSCLAVGTLPNNGLSVFHLLFGSTTQCITYTVPCTYVITPATVGPCLTKHIMFFVHRQTLLLVYSSLHGCRPTWPCSPNMASFFVHFKVPFIHHNSQHAYAVPLTSLCSNTASSARSCPITVGQFTICISYEPGWLRVLIKFRQNWSKQAVKQHLLIAMTS
jgi:hypothetical protein